MTPAEYISDRYYAIGLLKNSHRIATDDESKKYLMSKILEQQRLLDDFIEYAEGMGEYEQ